MTRPTMVCIQQTCPECGALNRVFTPEVRPSWNINCSCCSAPLIRRRRFQPRLVEPIVAGATLAAIGLMPSAATASDRPQGASKAIPTSRRG